MRKALARTRGRPADKGVGRDAVLAATKRLLQELPPARVTISSVAREAGVDPALIRYYFGDRSNLLLAVVTDMLNSFQRGEEHGDDALEILRTRIANVHRFTRSAKHMHRLMIDELADTKSTDIRKRQRELNLKAVAATQALMDGDPRVRRVTPLFLYLTIVGIFDFFVSAEPMIKGLTPQGVSMKQASREFEDFVFDLLINGLRKR